MMRISIVGTGYVGLSTAVCFADKGYRVIASTHEPSKASLINEGKPPFYEPNLASMLKRTVERGTLRAVLGRGEAVLNSDVTFIAVGTPSKPDGDIDLVYIRKSADEIGEALAEKNGYHLIVVKSTVVPGTTERLVKPSLERASGKKAGADFGLCMSPEFLRQGSSIHDTLNPDRVIIGEYDEKSGDALERLFEEFYGGRAPILRMNLASAEMVKYANNAMLAARISFINEIASLCERIGGVDVKQVSKAIGLDERIGPHFLNAGVGWGGSCFPKDVKALIAFSRKIRYEPSILSATITVNDMQAVHAVEAVKDMLGGLKDKKIAILGLSFKPETDDMREAPSIKIINRLLKEGASISAFDPVAMSRAKTIFGDSVTYASSIQDCLENADCCILVTEWDVFRDLEPGVFKRCMKSPAVFDGRRIYDPEKFRGIKFKAIGLS